MTPAQLLAVMPLANSRIGAFIEPINSAMAMFSINSTQRRAAFLATIAHETGQLARIEENLNYSAVRLMVVFPRAFPNAALAAQYANQPQRIANRVYANRNGNGSEESGDGWRNRGAGCIQLTFERNHAACATYFGIARDKIAAWLRTPEGASKSAGWFWSINKLNTWADQGDIAGFDGVSDIVNQGKKTSLIGDSNGWADRLATWQRALRVV